MRGDRGDIVLGWLSKVVVVLAIAGLIAFEAISVAVTRVRASDNAENAAYEASETYLRTHNVQAAFDSAFVYVTEAGGELSPKEFSVTNDGTVTLTVRRTAATLVLYRFNATEKWTSTEARATVKSGG